VLDESLVNGAKPMPMQLLMGVRDELAPAVVKVRLGSKANSDMLLCAGSFATQYALTSGEMLVRVGQQEFSATAANASIALDARRLQVQRQDRTLKATFDFTTGSFQLTLSGVTFEAGGLVDLVVEFPADGRVLGPVTVDLGQRAGGLPQVGVEYSLEELRRYDVPGAWWDYDVDYMIDMDGEAETGETWAEVSVDPTTHWWQGHECTTVRSGIEGTELALSWYNEGGATYLAGWQTGSPLGDICLEVKSLMVAPETVAPGRVYRDKGTFEGTVYLDIDWLEVESFSGKSVSALQAGQKETVTVAAGTFEAVPVDLEVTMTGVMVIKAEFEGRQRRVRIGYQAKLDQKWWGVEGVGIVRSESAMTVRVSGGGENMVVETEETDELVDYGS
jgi:hypothetical protein